MAENYEVTSQRMAMEVDGNSGELVDTVEVTAKAIPSGASFTVSFRLDQFTEEAARAELEAKATTFNRVAAL